MSEPTIEELQKWSAEKVMGFIVKRLRYYDHPIAGSGETEFYVDFKGNKVCREFSWQPDNPSTGQIWQVVEKMRELGWTFSIFAFSAQTAKEISATFSIPFENKSGFAENINPCLAILRAAYAALNGR